MGLAFSVAMAQSMISKHKFNKTNKNKHDRFFQKNKSTKKTSKKYDILNDFH
jgi:hypothetical protein